MEVSKLVGNKAINKRRIISKVIVIIWGCFAQLLCLVK